MSFYSLMIPYILVFIFSCIYISFQWKYYVDDEYFPKISTLRSINILDRVWPTDNRFFGLKFGAFRHLLVAIASAAAIWFLDIRILNTILLTLNLLYALARVPLHRARIRAYKRSIDEYEDSDYKIGLLKPVKNACAVVFYSAVIDYLLLLLIYGLRP